MKTLSIPNHIHTFIITLDSHPMAWENNAYPECVFIGTEEGAQAFTDKLQGEESGEGLYEFLQADSDAIHYESVKIL